MPVTAKVKKILTPIAKTITKARLQPIKSLILAAVRIPILLAVNFPVKKLPAM